MKDTLGGWAVNEYNVLNVVLILVLMEDTLGVRGFGSFVVVNKS